MIVLFVCVANVGRSQMAEAFFKAGVPREAISIYPGGPEMGAEVVRSCNRTMISQALALVLVQRLARKLCKRCSTNEVPPPALIESLASGAGTPQE